MSGDPPTATCPRCGTVVEVAHVIIPGTSELVRIETDAHALTQPHSCTPGCHPSSGDPLSEAVFTALGEASMCWDPSPARTPQVFDYNRALDVGERLLTDIRRLTGTEQT